MQVDACTQRRGKNDRLRISCVDFAAEIKVRDAAELGNALTLGIGHAKAFGCGLLRVRPVR
ncbi:MAG: type I-E CRISPR-associated protein Cas6/Cse3/CasE [Burkholderiaceae bacterium]|nr:type I-E CRISPR-associated protein Cas6/Cse3/CasE [Burkholderiaceae bacterium]